MDKWELSLKYDFKPLLEMLEGIAIIDSKNNMIKYFPLTNLPGSDDQRFESLFSFKPKWSHQEILPYIKDLFIPGSSIDQLLTKYTRISSSLGETFYSSK